MKYFAIVLSLAGLLAGCDRAPEQDSSQVAPQGSGQQLDALVHDYYERYLELNPLQATDNGDDRYNDRLLNDISEKWLADALALESDSLKSLEKIDPQSLDPAHRLTYDVFRYGRAIAVDGFTFPSELLPVNQFSSLPLYFAQLGSGETVQPFRTLKDYEDFLRRIDGFVVWTDQAVANMKQGMSQGIVQPRVVIERSIPQLASLLVDDPASSLFYRPIENMPGSIAEADRVRLRDAYLKAIREQILPACKRLHDFLKNEYLPAGRDTVGMFALPNGTAWYAYLVRRHTTTDLTAEAIHDIGLKEIARIRGEMERVKKEIGVEGDLKSFFAALRADPQFQFATPEELMDAYRSLKERVNAELPKLFSVVPKGDFEVKPVEAFREKSAASAYYQTGTPDGSRLGIFYVNTYDLPSRPRYMLEPIYLHEADPGHHFQLTMQLELKDLPAFRRFTWDTAYVEGWGLYAESLGRELGLYQDPYQYFGSLTAEAWRAARLVVDTGIHAKGWTRERGIGYMRDNTAVGESDIVAEVERYIAYPGQALAYKMGQLKIREMRTAAEKKLGGNFDVRELHSQVLDDGSLPLSVLQAKLERWMEQRKQ